MVSIVTILLDLSRIPLLYALAGSNAGRARVSLVMAVSTILFEDIFDVKDIDQDGKKFERGQWYNGTWCMQI